MPPRPAVFRLEISLRGIPVVIVTVVDEKDVGLALGASDYLVKPIERDALLGSLRRIAHAANVQH